MGNPRKVLALLTLFALGIIGGGIAANVILNGDDDAGQPSNAPAARVAAGASPAAVLGSCIIYRRGTDLRVRYEGPSPESACQRVAQEWSSGTQFWSTQAGDEPFGQLTPACTVADEKYVLTVLDTGSQQHGNALCGGLIDAGLVEAG
jgi:hypothetical protein